MTTVRKITQWGVLKNGRVERHCTDPGGYPATYNESLARYDGVPGETLMKRTVYVIDDINFEWEVVE